MLPWRRGRACSRPSGRPGRKEVTCSVELKTSIDAIVNTMQRVGYCLKEANNGIHPAKAYYSSPRRLSPLSAFPTSPASTISSLNLPILR